MTSPGNQIRTTQEGMQSAIQKFQSTTDEFNGYLRQENEMISQLRSTYTGDSASSYGTAMDEWENQFSRVINDLTDMMRIMGVNVNQYVQTEEQNANIAKSFSSALPNFQAL